MIRLALPFFVDKHRVFTLLKYTLYFFLCLNGAEFIREEMLAAEQTLKGELSLLQMLRGYAVTADTAAWLSLLLIYELETAVVEDEYLQGGLRWLFFSLSALCYLTIVYAFAGYLGKVAMLYDIVPYIHTDLCSLPLQGWTLMTDLDVYETINADNCAAIMELQDKRPLFQIREQPIIVDQMVLSGASGARALAWVDFINAGAWLLIVALIQLDIVLQLRGNLHPWVTRLSFMVKSVLYATLLAMAVYWGIYSAFIDFWDALLWLLGFVFIELNILSWNKETQATAAEMPAPIR